MLTNEQIDNTAVGWRW